MEHIGFDATQYQKLQTEALEERLRLFSQGTLYLEIGGKFLRDAHAARVLPGFNPKAKTDILLPFATNAEIIYSVSCEDVISKRKLNQQEQDYALQVLTTLSDLEATFQMKPTVALNFFPKEDVPDPLQQFIESLTSNSYSYFKRYRQENYPEDAAAILSHSGFGQDEYFSHKAQLIVVTGPASNSGKLSTCLGQMWHDHKRGIKSGYAKYELFPIWNLPLHHPVNLAYEAATVDIGDYNCLDPYHEAYYHQKAVNYNRDVEAFEIILALTEYLAKDHPLRTYHSPTDMGINEAGFAITNDHVVRQAALEEIQRRMEWYQSLLSRGQGKAEWVKKCETLLNF